MSLGILNTKGWNTEQSYSNDFDVMPRGCAVYAIVRPVHVESKRARNRWMIIHEVLYVGMSTNLKQRFLNHAIKKLFDQRGEYIQIWFQRCPKSRLRSRERRLIKKFDPPYNVIHRIRGEGF